MDVAEMMDELDDSGFTDTESDRKVAMLNDALYDAAGREKWPFLQTTATLTFDGSSDQPTDLPANFETAMGLVDLSNGQKIDWQRSDVFDGGMRDLAAVGPPQVYYQVGDELHVWPIPPAGSSLRLRYYRVPTPLTEATLSADVDWPVYGHRILVLGALQRLYDMEDDPELAVRAEGKFEERIMRFAQQVFNRQTDKPDRIYIDPLFDSDLYD